MATNSTLISLDDAHYQIHEISHLMISNECQVGGLFDRIVSHILFLQDSQQGSIKYVINTSDRHLLPIIGLISELNNIRISEVCFY